MLRNTTMKELSEKLMGEYFGQEASVFGEMLDANVAKLFAETQTSDGDIEVLLYNRLPNLMGEFTKLKSNQALGDYLKSALQKELVPNERIEKAVAIFCNRIGASMKIENDFALISNKWIELYKRDVKTFVQALKINELSENEYTTIMASYLMESEKKSMDIVDQLTLNYQALVEPLMDQINYIHRIGNEVVSKGKKMDGGNQAPSGLPFFAKPEDKKQDEKPALASPKLKL